MTKLGIFILTYICTVMFIGTYYYVADDPVSAFYGLGVLIIEVLIFLYFLYKKPKPTLIYASKETPPIIPTVVQEPIITPEEAEKPV